MSDPKMIMTDFSQNIDSKTRLRIIGFLLLLGLLAAVVIPDSPAESYPIEPYAGTAVERVVTPTPQITPQPTATVVDPYSKYIGQAVPHPRREADELVTIKISRYDPQLGGTNCFRWGNGTCLSPMANGERWETNYEIAIACPGAWPFGTLVEIGWRLWICKDRGGAIIENRPGVFWVDQLTTKTYYSFGTEMEASVWFPAGAK